ncbi:MAG: ECF transporter S component [Actinocatenispora sp.]
MADARVMRWRTIDIVVASVIGVAFGVVFWVWDLVWKGFGTAFDVFKPAGGLIIGVWMLAAVVGGLVIRKPGAAVYTEFIAALVSTLIGNQWGMSTVLEGIIEALGGELAFLLFAYRSFRLPTALLSGALAAVFATVFEWFAWYPVWSWGWKFSYTAIGAVSGLVIAGLGGYALVGSMARTGVLDRFGAGRERVTV